MPPLAEPVRARTHAVAARLRLWPAVVVVLAQLVGIAAPLLLDPGTFSTFMLTMFVPSAAAGLLAGWWLGFSRRPWADRLGVALAVAVVAAATMVLGHPSLTRARGSGTPWPVPMYLLAYPLPVATTLGVLWLVATPRLRWPVRRAGLVLVAVAVAGVAALLRIDGTDGGMVPHWAWRWAPTADDRELQMLGQAPAAADAVVVGPGDWPGFRGPLRDGRVTGVRIHRDWAAHPPRLLWRKPVGAGWSSVAVVGRRLFTQEQRGDREAVVCYDADTGVPLWGHTDAGRFEETFTDVGPRATPTVHNGRVYALGATGRLNCLDAATGRPVWAREVTVDGRAAGAKWGYASSPLVWHGVVTVYAGGPDGRSLLGYDADTGDLKWAAGEGTESYASPHPATLGGVDQVLFPTEHGLTAVHPETGAVLWHHHWPMPGYSRVVQPAVVGPADVLLGSAYGFGTRRLHVPAAGAADVVEVWTARKLLPYYNDFVVHAGHVYGLTNEGQLLVCVDLADGQERWRERRYERGQLLLLADDGLLLVVTEKGQVALVEANPDRRVELGRFRAVSGKTWNHPVVAHGRLYVRNAEEMACFELAGPD